MKVDGYMMIRKERVNLLASGNSFTFISPPSMSLTIASLFIHYGGGKDIERNRKYKLCPKESRIPRFPQSSSLFFHASCRS